MKRLHFTITWNFREACFSIYVVMIYQQFLKPAGCCSTRKQTSPQKTAGFAASHVFVVSQWYYHFVIQIAYCSTEDRLHCIALLSYLILAILKHAGCCSTRKQTSTQKTRSNATIFSSSLCGILFSCKTLIFWIAGDKLRFIFMLYLAATTFCTAPKMKGIRHLPLFIIWIVAHVCTWDFTYDFVCFREQILLHRVESFRLLLNSKADVAAKSKEYGRRS